MTLVPVTILTVLGAWWQWLGPGRELDGRFEGLTPGFNEQGFLCAVAIVILLAFLLRSPGSSVIGVATLVFLIVALVATGGRTNLAATVVASFIVVVRSLDRRLRVPTAIGGFVLLAVAALLVGNLDFYRRAQDGTLNGRDVIWAHAVDLIRESPLFGHGMMAGESIWIAAANAGRVAIEAGSAHNLVLEIAVGGGLIGLMLFFGSMSQIVVSAFRNLPSGGVALFVLLFGVGVTQSMVHKPNFVFWLLGGIAAMAARQSRDRRRRGEPDHPPKPLIGARR